MSETDESYDGAMKRAHRAEAKVRELEAELEELQKDDAIIALMAARKRAEKAEKELEKVNGLASGWNAAMRQAKARAEKAEATLESMTFSRDEQLRLRAELERENTMHIKNAGAEKERGDGLQAYIDKFGWNADAKQRIAEASHVVAHTIDDARQWGYDEPVVELSSPTAAALFASSKVLAIYNWLKQVEPDGGSK